MGEQIIKQPDGRYCIFNTIPDGITVYDASEEEIVNYFVKEATERTVEKINDRLHKIKKGEPAYYQFTMSFEEAIEKNREAGHEDIPFGEEEEDE